MLLDLPAAASSRHARHDDREKGGRRPRKRNVTVSPGIAPGVPSWPGPAGIHRHTRTHPRQTSGKRGPRHRYQHVNLTVPHSINAQIGTDPRGTAGEVWADAIAIEVAELGADLDGVGVMQPVEDRQGLLPGLAGRC